MSADHGASHPTPKQLDELRAMVRDGRIDTVIVALTDMQGRLMGKRVQAEAFLNGVVDHGIHFCTYLLGTDMEMNTPDGFKLMNWETGYGDWVGRQVWETTRVLPWLDSTAIVLCDAVDEETGEEIPISPRTMLKRQVERAAALGYTVKAGTEFEFYVLADTFEDLAEKGYNDVERVGYYNEDYHLLQATKLEPLYRQIRNQMTEAGIPIEFSKGEAAPSQHEVNIRYDGRARGGRPQRAVQARGQGDRLAQRLRADVHGQALCRLDGLERPSPRLALGCQERQAALLRGRRHSLRHEPD